MIKRGCLSAVKAGLSAGSGAVPCLLGIDPRREGCCHQVGLEWETAAG